MDRQTDRQTEHQDLLLELKNVETPDKPFRLAGQKYLLTYKTHICKETFSEFIDNAIGRKCKKLYIAHETGTNDPITPYEHSHVVVDFGKAVDKKSARVLDFNDIHPNIRVIGTKPAWLRACSYVTKEDKTFELAEEDKPRGGKIGLVDMIWENATLADALRDATKLQDIIPIMAAYKAKPVEEQDEIDIHSEDDLYPWQRTLWEVLQTKPNGRSVYWIYDEVGGKGKTEFMKWACFTHPEKCNFINNVGKIADFANNLKNFKDEGFKGNTIFFNLTRDYTEKDYIYTALEIVADGIATCTKYQGGNIRLGKMHVVVLANFFPNKSKLSEDRWKITTI